MSWNFNKDKNKDQPKRKGAKGKFKSYIIFPILFILKKQHGKMKKSKKILNL